MSEASFTVQAVDDVPVVVTPEDIDITNADELRAMLLEASASAKLPARAAHPPVIADMSGTQFCDSSGLNVLVREHQRTESEGGALLLAGLTEPVQRIIAVTGIDRMLRIFPSLEAALCDAVAGRDGCARRLPAAVARLDADPLATPAPWAGSRLDQ